MDIAFTKVRLAVFVDGCFWHSCPAHGRMPHHNRGWWGLKLAANADRDHDTDEHLHSIGWTVLRIWEHVPADEAADLVEGVLDRLLGTSSSEATGPVQAAPADGDSEPMG